MVRPVQKAALSEKLKFLIFTLKKRFKFPFSVRIMNMCVLIKILFLKPLFLKEKKNGIFHVMFLKLPSEMFHIPEWNSVF